MACILLFGTKEAILSCVPGYKTDAIYRVENVDRYDDRLIVENNLIESYDLLMGFIAKHTNDKFFLIDNLSTSVRSAIAREIVSNLLVHREFGSAFPAKLIIDKEKIYTENWNRAQRIGRIELQDFTPYPKNPILANFFVNIGYADSLGSGVRNLYKYTKIYSGGEPDFEEGDIFKLTVPLKYSGGENKRNSTDRLSERQNTIIGMIRNNNSIQVEDIAQNYGLSRATILREIQEIKKTIGLTYDKKEKNGTSLNRKYQGGIREVSFDDTSMILEKTMEADLFSSRFSYVVLTKSPHPLLYHQSGRFCKRKEIRQISGST